MGKIEGGEERFCKKSIISPIRRRNISEIGI